MTRVPGCLPTIIPDSTAVGLVQMSDANGNVSWQPITAPDVPAGTTSAAGILQLDGTATDIQPLGTQAAGASGLAADGQHVHPFPSGFYATDAGYLAWAYDPLNISAVTALTTSGNVYLTRINIRTPKSVTNVVAYMGALGGTLTSGQCFAGLYAGTTAGAYTAGQLIGTSADQTSAWNTGTGTANALQTIALTGAPFSVPAGFVWAALMFNGTTGPQFGRAGNVTAAASNIGFAAASARFAAATGSTTLPSSITVGNNALQAPEYWAALS